VTDHVPAPNPASTPPPPPNSHAGGDGTVRAAIWSAIITVSGSVAVAFITYFLGSWHLGNDDQGAKVPLKISIKSPTQRVSPEGEVFTGRVEGLRSGQTVWLFSKQMTNSAGKPVNSGVILINQGPCDVTETDWSCPKMRVGGPGPQDDGMYQVWATVVEPRQARQLVMDQVENKSVFRGDAEEPPYTSDGGRYSENVTRS
jgi:hypothetical protein